VGDDEGGQLTFAARAEQSLYIRQNFDGGLIDPRAPRVPEPAHIEHVDHVAPFREILCHLHQWTGTVR
jgi:hypothetical protein